MQRWLQTDFRQERRWKLATCYQIGVAIREWHTADAAGRKILCVRARIPTAKLSHSISDNNGMDIDPVAQTLDRSAGLEPPSTSKSGSSRASVGDIDAEGEVDMDAEGEVDAEGEAEAVLPEDMHVKIEGTEPTISSGASVAETMASIRPAVGGRPPGNAMSATEAAAVAARDAANAGHSLSYPQLVSLRAPIFNMDERKTIINLQELPLSQALPPTSFEYQSLQLLNMILLDMPLYEGPVLPTDGRVDRRFDESTPHHSRISQATKLLDSKPVLLSTLIPSKRRTRVNTWSDMSDLMGEDIKELESKPSDLPIGSGM